MLIRTKIQELLTGTVAQLLELLCAVQMSWVQIPAVSDF